MPIPEKEIRFSIETIESMMYNKHIYSYFEFLSVLIEDDFVLEFYRDDNKLTSIKDQTHLENFKRSFKFIK